MDRPQKRPSKSAPAFDSSTPEPAVAAWEFWAERTPGLPKNTLRGLMGTSNGPPTFVLGRRRFIARDAWHAWLASAAASGGFRIGRATRPKATAASVGATLPKRGRGRPRKHPRPAPEAPAPS